MGTALAISKSKLESLPPSLREALTAGVEAVTDLQIDLAHVQTQIEEQHQKRALAESMGLNLRGIAVVASRLLSKEQQIKQQIVIHERGYLEIPRMESVPIKDADEGEYVWKVTMPGNTPLRVFKAMKEAEGLFESIEIVRPVANRDPLIVGIIGDRCYYITSWR
ncbi:MAG: hypothetical protein ABIG63_07860 [Chloroflexota bacterium]